MTTIDDATPIDISTLLESLAAAAQAAGDTPQPLAQGTFAMYPMPDGGVMFVSSITDGPMAGIRHDRVPPGLIRTAAALLGGGSKMKALKDLTGLGRKRKAIGNG